MNSIDRLQLLSPWENVTEEDLFRVGDLYLSVRGNIRLPHGVWASPDVGEARRWVMDRDALPNQESWLLDAEAGTVRSGAGRPLSAEERQRFDKALEQMLNRFEGQKTGDVEFPIWFNVEEAD